MGVRISGKYVGNKNLELCHEPSGTILRTTPPKDNQGDGTSFSPTDLAAASLASCALTLLSIYAERNSISLEGTTFNVNKEMANNPRRIASLEVEIHLPKEISKEHRVALERSAMTCPVHHSLHPDVDQQFKFLYDQS